MKWFIVIAFGVLLAFPGQTAGSKVSFVKMGSYRELEGLPPKLEVTFHIACHQKFLKVIRQETVDKETLKVTISIGGLVEDSLSSTCQTPAENQEVTVAAGTTFSGREHEVVTIGDGHLSGL